MEKKLIDEVLAEVAPDKIVMHRRSPLAAIIVLLVGIVLLILNFTASGDNESGLQAGAALGGIVACGVGVAMLILAFTGKKNRPYSIAERKALHKTTTFYSFADRDKVAEAVRNNDLKALAKVPTSQSAAVLHICWATPSGKLRVEQVQEYIPHRYEPVTEVLVRQAK